MRCGKSHCNDIHFSVMLSTRLAAEVGVLLGLSVLFATLFGGLFAAFSVSSDEDDSSDVSL